MWTQEQALRHLQSLREAAHADWRTYGPGNRALDVDSTHDGIAAFVQREISGDNAWSALPQMTVALLEMHARSPAEYAQFIRGTHFRDRPEDPENLWQDPATLDGLVQLYCLVNSLSDDHDFVVAPSESGPYLAYQHVVEGFIRGCDPTSVLEAVRAHAPAVRRAPSA